MRAVFSRYLVRSAALTVAVCAAGPVHALSISLQHFSESVFDDIVNGLAAPQVETFESMGPDVCGSGSNACETAGALNTSVGTFETLGGTGTGESLVGSGTNLSLKTAASGTAYGRSNTAPGGAWWLDSNDTFGVGWSVSSGYAFDQVAFVLSDAADVGATLSVSVNGNFLANILNQGNGDRILVMISFTAPVLSADVEMRNDRLNDGFGIDDAVVGRVAHVPLPAAGLLLLGGIAGLAALRRRRRIS